MNLNLLGRIGARRDTPVLATDDEDDEAKEPEEAGSKSEDEEPEHEAASEDEPDEDDEEMRAATPGLIARLCAEAGCPAMADDLATRGVSVRELRERLGTVARIRAMVATARKVNKTAVSASLADRFLAAGHSPAEAGEALLEMLAEAQSPEIRNSHSPNGRPAERANHGWDRIVAGVNARLP